MRNNRINLTTQAGRRWMSTSRPPRTLTNEQDPKYIWHKTPAGLYRMPVLLTACDAGNGTSEVLQAEELLIGFSTAPAETRQTRNDGLTGGQFLRHRRICLLYGQQKHAENGHPELHVQSEGNTRRRQLHLDVLSL